MNENEKATVFAQAKGEALGRDEVIAERLAHGVDEATLSRVLTEHADRIWALLVGQVADLDVIDGELDGLRHRARLEVEARPHVSGDVVSHRPVDPDKSSAAQSGLLDRALKRQTTVEDLDRQIEKLAQRNPDWSRLSSRRAVVVEQLRTSLVDAMTAELRTKINEIIRDRDAEQLDRYAAPLVVSAKWKLRQAVNAESRVHTAAAQELSDLLDRTRQGAFGLAGPRGSGKSTILEERCVGSKPRHLRLAVSAPVDYVPREFLLYLYRRLCEEVLRLAGAREEDRWAAPRRGGRRIALIVAPVLTAVMGLFLTIGYVTDYGIDDLGRVLPLVLAILAVAVALVAVARPLVLPVGSVSTIDTDESRFGPFRVLPYAPRTRIRPVVTLACAVLASTLLVIHTQLDWLWLTDRRVLGAILVLFGLPAFLAIRRLRPSDVSSGTDFDAAGVIGRLGVLAALGVLLTSGVMLALLPVSLFEPDPRIVVGAAAMTGASAVLQAVRIRADSRSWAVHEIESQFGEEVQAARDGLARLQYQRSIASGRSAAVKLGASSYLPFGVESGQTRTTTDTELPWTVPDITEGIKLLLSLQETAVIGIDELDKIESDESARAFLNEIKGVFSAPHTQFIVSMSEDAIASFERRGLAFRDVFDSAFDEIVRVPYLSLTESRELVDKRVVGVPPPFVDLAHCQSGGLARDLIRALDQMVGLRAEDKALTPITNASVHRELRGKLQATVTALRPIPLEPQVTNVLKALYRLDLCPDDTLDSDRCVRRDRWLERVGALDLGVGGIDGDERASLRTLQRLAGEYTGFAYYCRTLIEFFRLDRFGVHGFLAAEGAAPSEPAGFEYLARARQNLAINPHLAWEQISNFRDGHGLESLPFPQSLLGGPASVASRGPQSISSDPRSDSRAVLDAARQSA